MLSASKEVRRGLAYGCGQTRGFGVKNEVHGQKREVAKIAKSWVLEAGYLSTAGRLKGGGF